MAPPIGTREREGTCGAARPSGLGRTARTGNAKEKEGKQEQERSAGPVRKTGKRACVAESGRRQERDKKILQQFLRIVNYAKNYIKNLAKLAGPFV